VTGVQTCALPIYIVDEIGFNLSDEEKQKLIGQLNEISLNDLNEIEPSSKDKLFFEKLAKHPDVHNFLIANLSDNEKNWIRDLAYSEDAEKTYKSWLKRTQSLSYVFKQELGKLDSDFNSNFLVKSNGHPLLLKLFLAKEISLETLCLLLDFTGAKKYWDSKMQYDLVYDMIKIKIEKYTPFIKCDKEKLKKIALDYFS
jgi:hypothetical protein